MFLYIATILDCWCEDIQLLFRYVLFFALIALPSLGLAHQVHKDRPEREQDPATWIEPCRPDHLT